MSHSSVTNVPSAIPELSVPELEKRMRSGGYSEGGFLGPTAFLEAVLTRDRHTLKEAQWGHFHF
jgi:hypothetical protein